MLLLTRFIELLLVVVMVLWLIMLVLLLCVLRLKWLVRKLVGVRFSVLVIRLFMFICVVELKMMLWVLIRNIWLLELMWLKIWLGFWLRMWFSVIVVNEGWLNWIVVFLLMLKVS